MEQSELSSYFEYKCRKGLIERGHHHKQSYVDRLDYEIGIINKMGFPGYFLIVQDFINWARGNNIYVGPGRGSAAGSLVSYCLRITNLDPLRWDLLFERFLNPGRLGKPDFGKDIENLHTNSKLTNKEIIDIIESGGVNDARLQNL